MKKMFLAAIFGCLAILTACDDDDEIRVDEQTRALFSQLYPSATNVEWERKNNYNVADFMFAGKDASAWFTGGGASAAVWQMTEYDMLYGELPAAIKNAFETGQYATWHIDDIDRIARPDMDTIYVIDAEQGALEMSLQYSSNGVLVKETADVDDDHIDILPPASAISSTITDYIASNYPEAKIVDEDIEHGEVEVEIVSGANILTLLFTSAGEWKSTTREDLLRSEVPIPVMDAFTGSLFRTYMIDDIEYWQTLTGNYYLFELESGNIEVYLKISEGGIIIGFTEIVHNS